MTAETAAFYAARPTIILDGEDHSGLTGGLLTLLVEETTDGLFRCEASFGNWDGDFLYFDRSTLDFARPFAVRVGADDREGVVFSGRIMALEAHFPQTDLAEVLVLAEDRLQDLRMTRRTRTYEDMSDSDIIDQIAQEHSLRTDIDMNSASHRIVAQVNQSDLAFIRERTRANDADAWIEDDTLYVQARARRDSGAVSITWGQELLDFSVMADLAHQRSTVSITGWDVQAKEAVSHEATQSVLGGESGRGESGAAVLEAVGLQCDDAAVHHVPLNAQEAQALAEAHYRQIARRFVTGSGTMEGDARVVVGTKLTIHGIGDLFGAAEYTVVAVQHTYDGLNGYRTHFQVESPVL